LDQQRLQQRNQIDQQRLALQAAKVQTLPRGGQNAA